MTSHPESEKLADALARCLQLATNWSGIVYRATSPKYANEYDLLTGIGSQEEGGRWNPKGLFPTVYASLDPETAMAEALQHYRYYELPIESAMPKTFVSVRVRLHHILPVLPITHRKVWRELGLSPEIHKRVWSAFGLTFLRLRRERWREMQRQGKEARTQAVGRLSWEAKLEGLLVPSLARPDGVNLVYFPKNQKTESFLEIINVSDLPMRP
jgi:RES domain-containing protein